MTNGDQSLKALMKQLIDEVSSLIRQELRLAQAEVSEKVSQAQTGAISIVAGLLLAFCALLILLQAVVIALSNVLPPWLASALVGLVVGVIAFAIVKQGQGKLRATNLTPERTVKSLQQDKDLVMERVK